MAYTRLLSLDELQAAADHNSPVFGPADVDCASCCDFLLDEPGSCLSQVTAETTKLDVSSALPTPRLLFDAPRSHQQIELPPSTLFDSPCHGGRAASPSAEEPSASAEVPPPPQRMPMSHSIEPCARTIAEAPEHPHAACALVIIGTPSSASHDAADASEDAASGAAPTPAPPSLAAITAFTWAYLGAADLSRVSVKSIRRALASSLAAEAGMHYDRAWLATEIDACLASAVAIASDPAASWSHSEVAAASDSAAASGPAAASSDHTDSSAAVGGSAAADDCSGGAVDTGTAANEPPPSADEPPPSADAPPPSANELPPAAAAATPEPAAAATDTAAAAATETAHEEPYGDSDDEPYGATVEELHSALTACGYESGDGEGSCLEEVVWPRSRAARVVRTESGAPGSGGEVLTRTRVEVLTQDAGRLSEWEWAERHGMQHGMQHIFTEELVREAEPKRLTAVGTQLTRTRLPNAGHCAPRSPLTPSTGAPAGTGAASSPSPTGGHKRLRTEAFEFHAEAFEVEEALAVDEATAVAVAAPQVVAAVAAVAAGAAGAALSLIHISEPTRPY